MKINLISIESSRPEWTQKAFNSYESKFNKSINITWTGCKPVLRSKKL
jgi:23S rRNA pseudoU1915 N3-methylase RlmH